MKIFNNVKDIEIKLEKTDIHPNDEIKGTVIVNYQEDMME